MISDFYPNFETNIWVKRPTGNAQDACSPLVSILSVKGSAFECVDDHARADQYGEDDERKTDDEGDVQARILGSLNQARIYRRVEPGNQNRQEYGAAEQ